MAHILVAYKQFPAPAIGHAGGQSVYRLLEQLHRRGHRLTLVARIRDEERQYLDVVRPLCERIVTVPHHRSLPGPRPLAVLRSYAALRRATVQTLRETQPDILHVEFAQTAVALLGVRYSHTSFRAHDVNWFLLAQQAARQRGLARLWLQVWQAFFRWMEPRLYRRFDLIAAISEGDRRLLAPRCSPRPVLLLPLSPNLQPRPEVQPAVSPGPNLLFVGAMSRPFNLQGVMWFLERVWPYILREVPATRLYIVGADPPESLRACHDGAHIFVTGFVEDLAAWYTAATVFVSPILVAGGLLQKVMDALSMGIPVVATSVSNHGLGATPGRHLCIADTPDAFAEAVVTLLRDPRRREALGAAGREFVCAHYDPEITMPCWEEAWLES
ncbi:MAG: hypothetical protein DRI37_06335 [Chloroflexi bacterium]|nr:MAG: hypothetical protein DRI37_06335 [Chloroflexota bacterium]